MALAVQPYHGGNNELDLEVRYFIEDLILNLADAFNIRVLWNRDTALMTGALTLAGGLVGGYAGGRVAAAIGAGIGGVTGLGVSAAIHFRELWSTIKEKLKELTFIVFNFLRRLDIKDYMNAAEIIMRSYSMRRELVMSIVEFIANKLGREVISSLNRLLFPLGALFRIGLTRTI